MLYETLRKRRSIRQYQDRPVEKEKLDTLLKAALLSPSSRAIRPWSFIVVDDRETLKYLARCKPHGAAFVQAAPLAIVVTADTSKSDVWVEDTAIASVILLLMAEELGLGACWCQVRRREHDDRISAGEYIRRRLNIPLEYEVESIIAIGYPAKEKAPYEESDLHYGKLRRDGYGTPYNP